MGLLNQNSTLLQPGFLPVSWPCNVYCLLSKGDSTGLLTGVGDSWEDRSAQVSAHNCRLERDKEKGLARLWRRGRTTYRTLQSWWSREKTRGHYFAHYRLMDGSCSWHVTLLRLVNSDQIRPQTTVPHVSGTTMDTRAVNNGLCLPTENTNDIFI